MLFDAININSKKEPFYCNPNRNRFSFNRLVETTATNHPVKNFVPSPVILDMLITLIVSINDSVQLKPMVVE